MAIKTFYHTHRIYSLGRSLSEVNGNGATDLLLFICMDLFVMGGLVSGGDYGGVDMAAHFGGAAAGWMAAYRFNNWTTL